MLKDLALKTALQNSYFILVYISSILRDLFKKRKVTYLLSVLYIFLVLWHAFTFSADDFLRF